MKKAAIISAIATACLAAGAHGVITRAVESSAPEVTTLRPETREHAQTVCASGSLMYLGQNDITSALPLVIEKFTVNVGDTVNIGDEIAVVDKRSSASLAEGMGQLRALAVPASDIASAVAMIPDVITSDCRGRVISTAVCGKAVQSGSSIASVARTEDLALTVAVNELDISKIAQGQSAEFTLSAYPDEVFRATVSDIAAAARDQYSGAVLETVVDVTLLPDDPDERMKAGFSAQAEIFLEEPRVVCIVPYSAIGSDERGEFIYALEEGQAVRRGIKTGAELPEGAEVLSGVSPDDELFRDPEQIAASQRVKIVT